MNTISSYYIRLYKKEWIGIALCILLTSLFPSFIPLINKLLIDEVFIDNRFNLFWIISLIFFILLVITSFANYYRHKKIQIVSEKIKIDLSSKTYRKLIQKNLLFFEKQQTGEVMSLFQSDIPQIIRIYRDFIPTLLQITVQVIFSITVLFFVSKIVLLLVLLFLPISIFISNRFKGEIRHNSLAYQDTVGVMNANLHDNLMGAKEIIYHTKTKESINEMNLSFNQMLQPTKNLSRVLGKSNGSNFFIYWFSFIIVLLIGGYLTSMGEITLGSLIAMLSYFMSLFGPINFLIEIYNSYQSTFGAKKRLSEIIYSSNNKIGVENHYHSIDKIKFANVSFKYENSKPILENVNISFNKGELVSIVGSSGAGKSTLLKLLLKSISHTDGEIVINDIPIKDWEVENLYKKISYLSQDYYLFNKSIKDNILFANNSLTDDSMIEISKHIGAHNFINTLNSKYLYSLGTNGKNLSGGQRQRVALIRALAKNYDVLILDEGTSSLDQRSANELIEYLIKLKSKNKIIIMITHNLELARRTDVTYELVNGQLKRKNSMDLFHQELNKEEVVGFK